MEAARPATAADIPVIVDVNQRHRSEMVEQRGGEMYLAREASPQPIHDRANDAIGDADTRLVVGTYDDVVFGYAMARFEVLADASRLAVLTDFVVDADARGSGIGEAMMNFVVDEAKAAGCRGIDSVALPGDRETKNFFESFGLKARMLTVHRSLVDD